MLNPVRQYMLGVLFSLVCISHAWANPANKNAVAGEIPLQDLTRETQELSKGVRAQVATWLQRMTSMAVEGGRGEVPPISDEAVEYLAVLYLYCNYKVGLCPFLLDTILDADVRLSKQTGLVECPTMSRFWKRWIAADLEKRASYILSVAAAAQLANFNSTKRPGYLQCKPTIKGVLADSAAYASRYGPGGSLTVASDNSLRLFQEVRSSQIDIFKTLGLTKGEP